MDQVIDWFYGQVVGFLGDFFAQMGNMGVELFGMSWVQSIVLFFSYLAWALYGVGLVVSAFETGIEYQNGRGSVKDALINALKGFLAVSLFTTVPVELFKLCRPASPAASQATARASTRWQWASSTVLTPRGRWTA